MNVQIMSSETAQPISTLELSEHCFSEQFNEALIHQVVTGYLTSMRQGTKAQKTRSQVRGGGKKPWRQKGTGRARAGSIRSPLWRGGGKTFAASPRSYTQKINKKMYRLAMRSILAELLRQERILVLEKFQFEEIKTKKAIALIQNLALPEKSILFVTDTDDDKFYLSIRNLPEVDLVSVECLDPVSLMRFEKVVFTENAIKILEETVQ